MKACRLTPEAFEDLDVIAGAVTWDRPQAAALVLARLRRTFQRLTTYPGLGHRREDLTPHEMLFFSEKPHLIVYRTDEHGIVVLRILHAARDVSAVLRGD